MQNIKENVMEKINNDEIKMKPKYYFILGSFVSLVGLIALVITSVFLISIISFSLRTHGPMGEVRFYYMLHSFPLWIPFLAILGIIGGIYFLKKYDFSYKRNIWIIISGFIFAVILSGILIDILGFDKLWLKRGPMREYMQNFILNNNLDNSYKIHSPGSGNGYGNGQGNQRFRDLNN